MEPLKPTRRTTYLVEVKHPTGFYAGKYEFVVNRTTKTENKRFMCFVTAWDFGCSKDYVVEKEEEALRVFLQEHGCTALTIKKTGYR